MPSLQVRELPDHVYGKLVESAKREHRSVAQQAVAILARGLGIELSQKEKRAQLVSELRGAPGFDPGDRLPPPEDLVREDRKR